jgi:hypothetical protein
MNDQGESGWIAQIREQLMWTCATWMPRPRRDPTARARPHWMSAAPAPPWLVAAVCAGDNHRAVLALTVTLRSADTLLQAPTLAAPAAADDFELLAGGEDLEMIEDLEFYAWLEQQSLDG